MEAPILHGANGDQKGHRVTYGVQELFKNYVPAARCRLYTQDARLLYFLALTVYIS
jgi:hypothetical protein